MSGFGIGLLGGAAAGAVGGLVCVPGNVLPDRSPYIAGVMGIGAAAGAILGLIAGSGVHQEKPLFLPTMEIHVRNCGNQVIMRPILRKIG